MKPRIDLTIRNGGAKPMHSVAVFFTLAASYGGHLVRTSNWTACGILSKTESSNLTTHPNLVTCKRCRNLMESAA